MPQLITYAGRPVKRRERANGGLLLTFYSPNRGDVGQRLLVSEDQWRRSGRIEFYASGMLPDVRKQSGS